MRLPESGNRDEMDGCRKPIALTGGSRWLGRMGICVGETREWLLLSAIWLPFSGLAVMNLFSEYGSLRDGLLWMIPTVCGLHRLWSGWCGLRKVRYSEEKQRLAVYMWRFGWHAVGVYAVADFCGIYASGGLSGGEVWLKGKDDRGNVMIGWSGNSKQLKQQLLQMMDEFGKATGLPILER